MIVCVKMATISILANTMRPSVDRRLHDTTFRAGKFSWQDPAHSWKAGPCEVMTVENLFEDLDVIHFQFSVKTLSFPLSVTNKDNSGCKMEFWMSEIVSNKMPEQSDTGTVK